MKNVQKKNLKNMRRKTMSKKLTIKEIEDKINAIWNQYPRGLSIDSDKDIFHPYDRNNSIRYESLLRKRKKEEEDAK